MKKGGPLISPKIARTFSIAGFIIMVFLVIFGIMYYSTNSTSANDILISALFIITLWWFCISVINFSDLTNSASKKELLQSKARESLQRDRISTIINNMTEALISTDDEGSIIVYNAASLNLLDTNVNLSGHNIDEILPLINQEGDRIVLSEELKKAKTTIKRDDLSYKVDVDDMMRLEVTYSPIRSNYNRTIGSPIHNGYVLMIRDITKAKSLEEERDEFISVVSHELRTPIAIAEGTVSNALVMLDHKDSTKHMVKDCINNAHDQILFLSNMINDLSTLSRAERGVSADTEVIDVNELAHKLYEKYRREATDRNLSLNLDLSPKLGKINVSRLYLEELLQNFITNALKYTKEGNVDIIFKQKNGSISFAVKDSGIGISKGDQAKVFNKFFRSEDYRTRETGGTGLGLYIAAKLAHKLGVKIQLVSRLNFGSTFSFTVPEYKEAQTLTDKKR